MIFFNIYPIVERVERPEGDTENPLNFQRRIKQILATVCRTELVTLINAAVNICRRLVIAD